MVFITFKVVLFLYISNSLVTCTDFLDFVRRRRCGIYNGLISSIKFDTSGDRIAGGDDVDIAEVPYHVRFGDCSGVIVAPRWILSAAHCIEKSDEIQAGSDTQFGEQVIKVIDTVPHPKFTFMERMQVRIPALPHKIGHSDTYPTYDLMLLLLEKDLEYTEHVRQIELGDSSMLKPGAKGSISGWGKTWFLGSTSGSLRIARLPVYDKKKCKRYHQLQGVRIDESMFCALSTDGTVDACPGDSGGPFVIDSKLVGIASFGRGCGTKNTPGIWTDVTAFKDWIYSIIYNSSYTKPGASHDGLNVFNFDQRTLMRLL